MNTTEYDKLLHAAEMISQLSNGRLEVRPSVIGNLFIRPDDNAYIGMQMNEKYDYANQQYDVTFQVFVRRMAQPMDSRGLFELYKEVWEAWSLLKALETEEYHPTQEDLQALRELRQSPAVWDYREDLSFSSVHSSLFLDLSFSIHLFHLICVSTNRFASTLACLTEK